MIPYINFDRFFPKIGPFELGGHTIGPIGIHMFGILVATGIIVGARLTQKRGRELGLTEEMVSSMISWSLICGFLFSHIFDVFAYQTFGLHPTLFEILNPFGGLSSYGGFAGAVGGLFAFCISKKQKVMPYADSLAFGLAAGWLFGRLGCFSAHDHPGHFTDFFLAVKYPDGVRHDLGLYEAIWSAGITAIFLLMFRKKQPLGIYVGLLTTAYAPVRFFLDFLRAEDTPNKDPRYFGLTPAQYGCIIVIFVGIGLLVWTKKHAARAQSA